MYQEDCYLVDLQKRLGERRYSHSCNVAMTAKRLAGQYGVDTEKAYYAGLLHDIWKDEKSNTTLAFFKAHGMVLTPCEQNAPKLWHAMAGAVYLRETYGFDDEFIDAVRYHTTGREGMSTLERIVFTADFISADRSYPGVEEMRVRAALSLESAMEEGLRFTIEELITSLRPVHPDTIMAYNDVLLHKKQSNDDK